MWLSCDVESCDFRDSGRNGNPIWLFSNVFFFKRFVHPAWRFWIRLDLFTLCCLSGKRSRASSAHHLSVAFALLPIPRLYSYGLCAGIRRRCSRAEGRWSAAFRSWGTNRQPVQHISPARKSQVSKHSCDLVSKLCLRSICIFSQ